MQDGNLSRIFNYVAPFQVMVLGDFMLDTYTKGSIDRISPEAPVSVMHVDSVASHPGGAGNVCLNLAALGAKVYAIGRCGKDQAGEDLAAELQKKGVDTSCFVYQQGYITPIKNRLIASHQQVLRVDQETIKPLDDKVEASLLDSICCLMDDCQIIAISDYNKGFLTPTLLTFVIGKAREKNIPVVVDPKGEDFSKYKQATIVKPNLKEAYLAAQLPKDKSIKEVAQKLLHQTESEYILITRSQEGISLFDSSCSQVDFPVSVKEVKDVTGAGDTVLATLCLSLANGLKIQHAAMLANIAAGIAIEKVGCAQISLSQLARRLLEVDSTSKIFDESHLFALQHVVREHPFSLLAIHSKDGFYSELFQAIRALKKDKNKELILYITDDLPNESMIDLLSSLQEVDFIIIKEDCLHGIFDSIKIKESYMMENKKLKAFRGKALLSKLFAPV